MRLILIVLLSLSVWGTRTEGTNPVSRLYFGGNTPPWLTTWAPITTVAPTTTTTTTTSTTDTTTETTTPPSTTSASTTTSTDGPPTVEGPVQLCEPQDVPDRDNPHEQVFDFIIVGGGAAGSVLASRLSEFSNVTVLLLEAGGTPPVSTTVPLNLTHTWGHSSTDWEVMSEPQTYGAFGTPDRKVGIPQARMLGGCGNHNGQVFLRGNPRDFDAWANLTGDPQWSYNSLLPFFKKSETYKGTSFSVGNDHGTTGPISVSELTYRPLAAEWVDRGRELGLPYTDPNTVQQESSFFHSQVNIGKGRRVSSYYGYLKPILTRSNLVVLTNAFVTKISVDSNNRATGIKFTRHSDHVTVHARREVILSAGAFRTPHLLMLSGIGNSQHLQQFGIETKVHLPGVGENLMDHVATFVGSFQFNQSVSYIPSRDLTADSLNQYEENGEGPLSSNMITGVSMWSTTGQHQYPDIQFQQILGATISEAHPYLENISAYDGDRLNTDLANVIMHAALPLSRGKVSLGSAIPFDPPVVDPNYYSNPKDLDAMVEGMKFIVDFYEKGDSYQKYGAKLVDRHFPGCENLTLRSKEYYRCYLQRFTICGFHFSSTCKMGKDDDPFAVLDSQLRVRGVTSLRVVDASVMPVLTSSNTNAPTILIGEKGADIIARFWGLT